MKKTSKRRDAKALLAAIPHRCGVYLFKDEKGGVIYVGKAKDLRNRVGNYFRRGADGRHHIRFMLPRISDVDFTITETEQEALILENNLIKKYRPRYNIFLRDDKTYVNLRLNVRHPFPRLTVVRNPKRDDAMYFGPFTSAGAVRSTLRTIGRVFPLRLCSDAELNSRKRPCLYYDIRMCPAPCVDLVDPQEYRETVNKVIMFLKGRSNELLKSLKEKMELDAAERRYEEAARKRDQIWAIQKILEKQRITSPQRAERDVFGVYHEGSRMVVKSLYVRDGKVTGGDSFIFTNADLPTSEHLSSFLSQYYQRGALIPDEVVLSEEIEDRESLELFLRARRGGAVKVIVPRRGERRKLVELACSNAKAVYEGKVEKVDNRELLEDLKVMLELRNFPRRIECFDVSNIGGSQAVASRVTFVDAEPARDLYRRYRIKTVEGADDYAMMKEVLRRRISRGLEEGDLPDLIAVDGGKGQLGVALKVIDSLGAYDVDVLAIAKVRDRESGRKLRGRERIYTASLPEPLLLEGNSKALMLLERIRDEAHRFAVTYHKKIRGRRMTASVLDDVPGVGRVLKGRLMEHFGSVARLKKASVAELAVVEGVSYALAARIKAFLGEL
jgi:excinuclease ABC subunit C